jgi:hypothetical protein
MRFRGPSAAGTLPSSLQGCIHSVSAKAHTQLLAVNYAQKQIRGTKGQFPGIKKADPKKIGQEALGP